MDTRKGHHCPFEKFSARLAKKFQSVSQWSELPISMLSLLSCTCGDQETEDRACGCPLSCNHLQCIDLVDYGLGKDREQERTSGCEDEDYPESAEGRRLQEVLFLQGSGEQAHEPVLDIPSKIPELKGSA